MTSRLAPHDHQRDVVRLRRHPGVRLDGIDEGGEDVIYAEAGAAPEGTAPLISVAAGATRDPMGIEPRAP